MPRTRSHVDYGPAATRNVKGVAPRVQKSSFHSDAHLAKLFKKGELDWILLTLPDGLRDYNRLRQIDEQLLKKFTPGRITPPKTPRNTKYPYKFHPGIIDRLKLLACDASPSSSTPVVPDEIMKKVQRVFLPGWKPHKQNVEIKSLFLDIWISNPLAKDYSTDKGAGKVHLFWRDNKNYLGLKTEKDCKADPSDYLVTRMQTGNASFINAPVMMLHYILVKDTKTAHCKTIDVAHFLKSKKTKDKDLNFIRRLILENQGGDSLETFYDFIGKENENNVLRLMCRRGRLFDILVKEIVDALETHGPALLPQLSTFKELSEPDSFSFKKVTIPRESRGSYHAVVLIGYRRDEKNVFFLFQNWSLEKPFFEISAEALADAAETELVFYDSRKTKLKIVEKRFNFVDDYLIISTDAAGELGRTM